MLIKEDDIANLQVVFLAENGEIPLAMACNELTKGGNQYRATICFTGSNGKPVSITHKAINKLDEEVSQRVQDEKTAHLEQMFKKREDELLAKFRAEMQAEQTERDQQIKQALMAFGDTMERSFVQIHKDFVDTVAGLFPAR